MANTGYIDAFGRHRAYTTPASSSTSKSGSYGGLDPGTISHQPFMDYANQIKTAANNPQLNQQTAGYASQLMNTAFDPQQALYNQQQHQLQEQVRAGLAARGLNSSAAGQGIENDALSGFNIDWQNQQLQRQLSAVNPYLSLANNPLNQMVYGSGAYNALGNTAQGIANTGFHNAGELGASQFRYPGTSGATSTYSHIYTPMSSTLSPAMQAYQDRYSPAGMSAVQSSIDAANAANNAYSNWYKNNSYQDAYNTYHLNPGASYTNNLSYFGGL